MKKLLRALRFRKQAPAYTLPELVISIAIFATVVTIVASTLIQTVRQNSVLNIQRQISEDARYVMEILEKEIKNGMIDYDEYYNRNVLLRQTTLPGTIQRADTYGQNYGAYYSTFYNPGSDAGIGPRLGFDCNDGTRNTGGCATPLRNTIDRNTGSNPYQGKSGAGGLANGEENAFCGRFAALDGSVYGTGCTPNNQAAAPLRSGQFDVGELYLISSDARQKTMLARELVGPATWALSLLRMNGIDSNGDGAMDEFVCAPEFECRGAFNLRANIVPGAPQNPTGDCTGNPGPAVAPRSPATELAQFESNPTCESPSNGFNKDFVPLSPTRVTISDLKFYISPLENPNYAFSEAGEQMQPSVTIVMTVQASPDYTSGVQFNPMTLVKTVYARSTKPVQAPVLVEP